MTDRPHYILKCPHFPGTITAEWFWLCVRSQCHQISRMRTFDENSGAISIMSPISLSSPRTQHVWWDHREKSRRASTLWDCRGKSRQTEPNVNAGSIPSRCNERGNLWICGHSSTSLTFKSSQGELLVIFEDFPAYRFNPLHPKSMNLRCDWHGGCSHKSHSRKLAVESCLDFQGF